MAKENAKQAYEGVTWNSGDVITKTKLQKIDDAASDFSTEVAEARTRLNTSSTAGSLKERLDDMIISSENSSDITNETVLWFDTNTEDYTIPIQEDFDSLILTQSTQPSTTEYPEKANKIWIKSQEQQVEIPTFEEFEDTKKSIAREFKTTISYETGEYVYYNYKLYRFINPHKGNWDNNDVEEITITNELFETISLIAKKSKLIAPNSNLNSFLVPGSYIIENSSVAQSLNNYPFEVGARLIVMQTTNINVKIQICISNNQQSIAWRTYVASEWSDWFLPTNKDETKELIEQNALAGRISLEQDNITDLNDISANTIYYYSSTNIGTIDNFPSQVKNGGLILTLNYQNRINGRIQFIIPWETDFNIFKRYYQTNWSPWASLKSNYTIITCGQNKDYTNLIDCLDYITSDDLRNTWSEDNQVIIQLDKGTYNVDKIVDLYNNDSERYKWGIYVPRYCTIKGRGKDETIITYDYDGDNDWILGHISPLNMPYESSLENLTIIAKNCRYCIHSDGDEPFSRTWALSNNKIILKNVKLIHNGYDEGKVSSYNVPSAWGEGHRTNTIRKFINCDFIAYHMPWFCHNNLSQDEPSYLYFENCKFINKAEATFDQIGKYESIAFISWGTNIKTYVMLKDCYLNHNIFLRNSTSNNSDATCDYYIYDNNNNFITESTVNNAHLLDTWCNNNCKIGIAKEAIDAYTPVSIDINNNIFSYSSQSYKKGIALHSSAINEEITVQEKGLIKLSLCGITGFSSGNLIGYNNGWIIDNENPIIKIIDQYIGEII